MTRTPRSAAERVARLSRTALGLIRSSWLGAHSHPLPTHLCPQPQLPNRLRVLTRPGARLVDLSGPFLHLLPPRPLPLPASPIQPLAGTSRTDSSDLLLRQSPPPTPRGLLLVPPLAPRLTPGEGTTSGYVHPNLTAIEDPTPPLVPSPQPWTSRLPTGMLLWLQPTPTTVALHCQGRPPPLSLQPSTPSALGRRPTRGPTRGPTSRAVLPSGAHLPRPPGQPLPLQGQVW